MVGSFGEKMLMDFLTSCIFLRDSAVPACPCGILHALPGHALVCSRMTLNS